MQNQLEAWNRILAAVMVFTLATGGLVGCASQQTFSSPEEGQVALVDAIRADDSARLQTILGRHGHELFRSGDTVADQHYRETGRPFQRVCARPPLLPNLIANMLAVEDLSHLRRW